MKTPTIVLDNLQRTIDRTKKDIKEKFAALSENSSRIPQMIEDLYKENYMNELRTELHTYLSEEDETSPKERVQNLHKYYTRRVLSPYVMEQSTSEMHRSCSIWRREVELRFLEGLTDDGLGI